MARSMSKRLVRAVLPVLPVLALAPLAFASPAQKAEVAAPDETHAAARGGMAGTMAPDFTLQDTEGKTYRLAELTGSHKYVVLEWFNPDCPFVKKHHEKNKTMATTYKKEAGEDLVWLAINSGAAGKQGNGVERNRKAREDYGIAYPVLLDESGAVGRAYGAKTTPTMFVIVDGKIVYDGAIDDNPTPGTLGQTNYVAAALDAVKAGKPVEVAETKSYGCSVKYGSDLP